VHDLHVVAPGMLQFGVGVGCFRAEDPEHISLQYPTAKSLYSTGLVRLLRLPLPRSVPETSEEV
jgi:hypothetical protein